MHILCKTNTNFRYNYPDFAKSLSTRNNLIFSITENNYLYIHKV
jgi:hypothetical protein